MPGPLIGNALKNIAGSKNARQELFFLLIAEIDVLSISRAGRALKFGLST
jgi:hypothetical protein